MSSCSKKYENCIKRYLEKHKTFNIYKKTLSNSSKIILNFVGVRKR